MIAPRVRGALWVGATFALAVASACGSSGTEPGGHQASAVSIVSGNDQIGQVGALLAQALVVQVSSNGTALSGATVNFAVTSGTATVSPSTATTDISGQAKTNVTLGATAGTVQITATVAGTSLSATFVATAAAATQNLACTTGSPATLSVGSVTTGVSGTGICLSGGGSGAEYALIPFYGNPDSSATTQFTVSAQGATAVSTADVTPSFNVAAAPATGLASLSTRNTLQENFDLHLREVARQVLSPMIPAARAAYRQRSNVSYDVIPQNVTVGQILRLNANAGETPAGVCTTPTYVGARVVAVTQSAIIVADTANPTGGFTDQQYHDFGVTFDTLINALDTTAFGAPTDIDHNGHILILFTKEVNKLTPKTGASGVIDGFFFERDLFPTTDTPQFQGCATSNFGEMFYVLVPDPTGVFSIPHTTGEVDTLTIGTLAHEYQHLINAGRRMYINTAATDFEDVWLNEGLSHIAEELLYYHVANTAPRQNLGFNQIVSSELAKDAFNAYQVDNFGRFEVFLKKAGNASPYAENDSLETRGATWDMLRYMADHQTSTNGDGTIWKQFDNSITSGQQNLAQVVGSDYLTKIRNWQISVFTDDLPSVTDQSFEESSWNMRSIFPQLCTSANCSTRLGVYPLKVVPLSDATPATLTLPAGGAAYLRFSVAANSQASIDWGGVSGLLQFAVVRTK